MNNENFVDVDQPYLKPRLLSSGFYIFDCPDPQCIEQFRRYSRLENHMTTGKHAFSTTKTPLLDQAKLVYMETIENDANRKQVTLNKFNNMIPTTKYPMNNQRSQGWALSRKKPPTHYNNDVIKFLRDAFDEGIATGNKWSLTHLAQVGSYRISTK